MTGVARYFISGFFVTSALTYMSQNGITVGDVFDKLTGKFDENARVPVSKVESVKTAGEQTASVNAYLSAAKTEFING
jgi:hypothetical protein